MNLYTLLLRLPYSLLITSFALAAAVPAESVELRVLTPDDFDQTIAKGTWFIEHFSPYCGHCRRFAPTWTQLVEENEKQQDPGIQLAQVNCAIHGDLCGKNGVDGYPQMNLYRNGEFMETYKEARDFDLLQKYLAAHAEPTSSILPPLVPETTPAPQVDEVAAVPSKIYNPTGVVSTLDEKSFPDAIKEGHIFIKFFAPWCGHCKKLAPIWTDLAAQMSGKLSIAEVDCDAHGALCRTQGVTGYPMLFYYGGNGSGKTEYTGGRRMDQLKTFAEKVSGPTVQELKYEDLQGETAAHDVLYLLLHPASDVHSLKQVTEASQVLFGSPPVYYSSSRSFYDHFSVQPPMAMVLAFKDHDYSAPAAVYPMPQYSHTSKQEDLTDWLLRNRLPTAIELDSDTFQEVMNAVHKPLVVIVAAPPSQFSQVSGKVQEIAKRWKDSKARGDVVFAWMDADKWGSWLKSMYGIKANTTPQVVVANHSRLIYYEVDQHGEKIKLTAPSIFSTINGAFAGTVSYRHSENMVERIARYLNNKLVVVEHVVEHHPWGVTFFVIACLGGLVMFLRRVMNQESALADELNRKARLD